MYSSVVCQTFIESNVCLLFVLILIEFTLSIFLLLTFSRRFLCPRNERMNIHTWPDSIYGCACAICVHILSYVLAGIAWHGMVCCIHVRGCRRTDINFIMTYNINPIFLFCLISAPCRWWMNFGSYSTSSSCQPPFHFIHSSHSRRHHLIHIISLSICIPFLHRIDNTHVCMCERRMGERWRWRRVWAHV